MTNWEPAPEGPPADKRRKFAEIHAWLDAHPGEWIVIRDQSPGLESTWRRAGYEVTARKRDDEKRDFYVRKPRDDGT